MTISTKNSERNWQEKAFFLIWVSKIWKTLLICVILYQVFVSTIIPKTNNGTVATVILYGQAFSRRKLLRMYIFKPINYRVISTPRHSNLVLLFYTDFARNLWRLEYFMFFYLLDIGCRQTRRMIGCCGRIAWMRRLPIFARGTLMHSGRWNVQHRHCNAFSQVVSNI